MTNQQADRLCAALEARGHRATATRRAVLEGLIACDGHISADSLVEKLHAAGVSIGRMTVFRTLDLLSETGLVRPIYQGAGAAHYIVLENGHHHHLVCTSCARVVEFDDCVLADAGERLAQRYGFHVQGHLLELFGTCADCRAAAG